VAALPPETSASIALLRNQCLAIINLATQTESKLFTTFGETIETLVVLSELKTVAQEATDALARLNSLQLKVAVAQPEISSALAKLISESRVRLDMRIPAWQRSIEEILLTWRLGE
jgi:nitrate/nitrite-specific signal transduction histidine kinase